MFQENKDILEMVNVNENSAVVSYPSACFSELETGFYEKNYLLGEEFEEITIDFDSYYNQFASQNLSYLEILSKFFTLIDSQFDLKSFDFNSLSKVIDLLVSKSSYVKKKIVIFNKSSDSKVLSVLSDFLKVMSNVNFEHINFLLISSGDIEEVPTSVNIIKFNSKKR